MNKQNPITHQACSVDDFRCYMKYLTVDTVKEKETYINYLIEAIEDESEHRNRITIIKMMESKLKQIQKF